MDITSNHLEWSPPSQFHVNEDAGEETTRRSEHFGWPVSKSTEDPSVFAFASVLPRFSALPFSRPLDPACPTVQNPQRAGAEVEMRRQESL